MLPPPGAAPAPQPSILKHSLSRSIMNRFLLLQHIYCLTQRIGSHCDTADIVIHSTVYTILVITWSRSDPTVIKKFQQQTSGKEEWREGQSGNMSPPLGGVTAGSPASPVDPLMECVLDVIYTHSSLQAMDGLS